MITGDILSYREMCNAENATLQRGMNFRLHGGHSVILMSVRPNAPYADRVEDDGQTLIYEGHDTARNLTTDDPKSIDQPMRNPSGTLTANGLFYEAAQHAKSGRSEAELVKVYEKLREGIWVYNGVFELVDAWLETLGGRAVFKFRLQIADRTQVSPNSLELDHERMIPSHVKLEVWKRDQGRCTECGSSTNLHFDHIIPFARGGSSLTAKNVQLLCARHNLAKSDRIK
jgi:hypothetical protein